MMAIEICFIILISPLNPWRKLSQKYACIIKKWVIYFLMKQG